MIEKAHSYLSAYLSPLKWTDPHGTTEKVCCPVVESGPRCVLFI